MASECESHLDHPRKLGAGELNTGVPNIEKILGTLDVLVREVMVISMVHHQSRSINIRLLSIASPSKQLGNLRNRKIIESVLRYDQLRSGGGKAMPHEPPMFEILVWCLYRNGRLCQHHQMERNLDTMKINPLIWRGGQDLLYFDQASACRP
jgi:hypothetical protein